MSDFGVGVIIGMPIGMILMFGTFYLADRLFSSDES